jgi:hypothetical protein
MKEMTMIQLKDILAEKRSVDKENSDLDQKIQGRGITEQESKLR